MSLDGNLLGRAKDRLQEKKHAYEEEYSRRREQVYRQNPRVRMLDNEIQQTAAQAIKTALLHGNDPVDALDTLREINLDLQAKRIAEITAAGYPSDYLDEGYLCPLCCDTGYRGSVPCDCLMELYQEEQRHKLSSLLKLGQDTFDNFDLDWYDDTPDPESGISDRSNMSFVYETCVEYARKFGKNSYNLFLSGGTGLGKTFLSTCIAKVVSEQGYSVVYDTAVSIFTKFEEEKFDKGEDPSTAWNDVRRFLSCDLLIIDDLGTELTTAFVVSTLYTIINSRLMSGKKTIISSNLSESEIRQRYSPQISSRLEGEYQVLSFFGKDIRLQKKGLY